MSENHFQVAVVGSGPGGYVAALKAAQLGARVAVVEQQPFFGGTCLNWGCIPSKALLASAELKHHLEHAAAMGIDIEGQINHNWPVMQKRKDKILAGLRGGIAGLFKARAVTPFAGRAALDGTGRLVVRKEGAENQTLTADKIILATGSEVVRIAGWPSDRERVCTSDEALHWATLPKKLVIVGGGIIGCEFACMMQPLGVDVTIVEMLPALMPGMDVDLVAGMAKIFAKRGIKLHLGVKVEDMQLVGDGVQTRLSSGEVLESDRVLVSIGRKPATKDIGLESVGLGVNQRGYLEVDEQMLTPNRDIYCIGDSNGRVLLAHAASAQGVLAAEHALGHKAAFTAPVPSCVYTFPELAGVGLTQQQCKEQGIPIKIGGFQMSFLAKAMAVGDTEGGVKVIRHRETDVILGVHMLGHNVTEVIAAAGALVHQKATAHEVAEIVFAHPTISESLKEAVEDTLDMCLHAPPKKMVRVAVGA